MGHENRVLLIEVKASRSDSARDDHTQRDRARLADRQGPVAEAEELTNGVLEAAAEAALSRDPDGWRHNPAVRLAAAER